jgi:hypothetical protein
MPGSAPSREAAVRSYVLNQEAHHRQASFEEELVDLLRKHGVELDPKYLFD